MGAHERLTGAQRAARRRAVLRAQGLRPIHLWVPDLRDPEVLERIRADAASLKAQAHRWDDVVDEVEALAADLMADLPPYDWRDEPTEAWSAVVSSLPLPTASVPNSAPGWSCRRANISPSAR